MTEAVAYMRCSSKAAFFGDTWSRQADSVNRYAANSDHELILYWQERAVPGKTEKQDRPAFQDMVATLLESDCRTIIVESLDRLAREYRVQEQLVVYLASKALVLISANTGENITEAMMGDPMRRAMVQIQGIFAELDKNLMISRTRKARERLRTKNGRCEGRKPYGSIEPEKMILDIIIGQSRFGRTAEWIADYLNSQGMWSRYGNRWNSGTVWKIIQRHRKALDKRDGQPF